MPIRLPRPGEREELAEPATVVGPYQVYLDPWQDEIPQWLADLPPFENVEWIESSIASKSAGGRSGRSSAADVREMIEARLSRQSDGFFTPAEVANIMAERYQGVDAVEWLDDIRIACESGKLVLRRYNDRRPLNMSRSRNWGGLHIWHHLLFRTELNAWLAQDPTNYQLPASRDKNLEASSNWINERRSLAMSARKSGAIGDMVREAITSAPVGNPNAAWNKLLGWASEEKPRQPLLGFEAQKGIKYRDINKECGFAYLTRRAFGARYRRFHDADG